jgi:hypothetical protein
MKTPQKRETVKAPAKPVVEEKKPEMDKPALQPEPAPAPKPHERYEHPERNA